MKLRGPGKCRGRPFWCGDDCFRYCYISKILEATGLRILAPAGPPREPTLRLPRKGSTFSHREVLHLLGKMGCIDDAILECVGGIPRAGSRGDIDIAAASREVLVVLEAKSRIIPRILTKHGIRATELILQYHLDEPGMACSAWKTLAKRKIIEQRQDSPSSIFELVREAVHLIRELDSQASKTTIILGAATPFYGAPFREQMLAFVERSARFLANCFHATVLPVVIIVTPLSLRQPHKAQITCHGEGCSLLGLSSPPLFEASKRITRLLSMYRPCTECRYRSLCYSIWHAL